MVKGVGYAQAGGRNKPITNPEKIMGLGYKASKALRESVKASMANPAAVRKGFNSGFLSQYGNYVGALDQDEFMGTGALAEIGQVLSAELQRSITLTSPLTSGFVPFDLVAPSRLIYPVYSPLRNKIPRVAGQGTSRRQKVVTGITGSQTGGTSIARISIPEIQSGSLASNNWPINLPPSGSQVAVDQNIPYQFFGQTEALSWLSQFAGQGFEDISALANLILLQEFMLAEEYEMIAGSSFTCETPSAPSVAARSSLASGETEAPFGSSGTLYVVITAVNYYGETVSSTAGSVALAAGDVYDVTATIPAGAQQIKVYAGTTNSRTDLFLQGTGPIGGCKFTLNGATGKTSGSNPPSADTGTSSSYDYEGLNSVLSGHANANATAQYPSGFLGSYAGLNQGTTLQVSTLATALQVMWDGASVTGGAFRADPAELICEGSDAMNLSYSLINSPTTEGYRLFLTQQDVAGITAGVAVSEFVNPVTRSQVKILVHPWLPQGRAYLMSYTLPFSFSNVSNVVENVMVQDYLSVKWPTIDASWRYSIYMYGALVVNAPMYCGVIGGLQETNAAPWS